uniref:hybrid sensor histidine kinase/response regulator n=1 Tax=Micromonospora sp. TaxID=1876 RepID=UPI003B3A3101
MSSARGGEDGRGLSAPSSADRVLPPWLAGAFAAGGEMGGRLSGHDWAASPLGSPDTWPAALSHAIGMMLSSRAQSVMFWGPDQLAFYNDAYRPTIGDKHPVALGRPAREHWAETWDVLGPLLDGVRRSGESYRGENHPFLLDRHGFVERVYFDISYDPIRDDDGSVNGVFCFVNETTGRVVGERRLRALAELGVRLGAAGSMAELGRATAAVLDGHRADVPFALVYLTDETGRPVPAGASGVAPARVPAEPPATLARVAAGGVAAEIEVAELLGAVPDDVAPRALVLPLTATSEPAGALVVGRSARLPFTDEYRDFLGLIAAQVSRVVGQQRVYEQERARAAELAALDRAKTNFFANVSHEFRTPLTLVLGPLEEMLADPTLSAEHLDRLTMMHRNGLRLLKLVNTVLDFSRLESGRLAAHYQPTDLAQYTSRLASTFRSATERAGLRLVVDCPPLPAPVLLDRDMWEKIVFNLLSNALKFTFDGEIRVRVVAVDGTARLEVVDTGVGIAAEEVPHVFERFHRVPGVRSRTHEGTGIGLALVRELVEMHGGTVAATSRVDHGTTVTVTVPFGSAHLPPDRVAAAAPLPTSESAQASLYVTETAWWTDRPDPAGDGRPAPATGHPARGGRILLADDNADLREHVTRLLSPEYEVVAVPDGAVALQEATAGRFDLVLTDVMMPRLDGFGLVTALRGNPATRYVPIVLL